MKETPTAKYALQISTLVITHLMREFYEQIDKNMLKDCRIVLEGNAAALTEIKVAELAESQVAASNRGA